MAIIRSLSKIYRGKAYHSKIACSALEQNILTFLMCLYHRTNLRSVSVLTFDRVDNMMNIFLTSINHRDRLFYEYVATDIIGKEGALSGCCIANAFRLIDQRVSSSADQFSVRGFINTGLHRVDLIGCLQALLQSTACLERIVVRPTYHNFLIFANATTAKNGFYKKHSGKFQLRKISDDLKSA